MRVTVTQTRVAMAINKAGKTIRETGTEHIPMNTETMGMEKTVQIKSPKTKGTKKKKTF